MEEQVFQWTTKNIDDLNKDGGSRRSHEVYFLIVIIFNFALIIATVREMVAVLPIVLAMGLFTIYAFYQDTYKNRIFKHTLTKTAAEVYSYNYYPNWLFAIGRYGWIAFAVVGLIGTFIVGPMALAGAAGMGLASALALRNINIWEKTIKEECTDTDPWSQIIIDRKKKVVHLQKGVPARRDSVISMGRSSFVKRIGGYEALPKRINTNEAIEKKIRLLGLGVAIEADFTLDEFLAIYNYGDDIRAEIEEKGLKRYTEEYGPGPYYDGPHLFAQDERQLNDIVDFVKTHINPDIEIREEAIGAPRPYWYCLKDWLKGKLVKA